jgi:Raf kinase inhibitor-like YbhB/YbcL family protein
MAFELTSPAFRNEQEIPRRFTCDGENLSPALRWTDAPPGTKALALIADDPDAPGGVFAHWVLYDIPVSARELAEGTPAQAALPAGAREGLNDFGKVGYGGPCPPPGPAHRYYFTLYALDRPTELPERATRQQLLEAVERHVLAEARLMGRYARAAGAKRARA